MIKGTRLHFRPLAGSLFALVCAFGLNACSEDTTAPADIPPPSADPGFTAEVTLDGVTSTWNGGSFFAEDDDPDVLGGRIWGVYLVTSADQAVLGDGIAFIGKGALPATGSINLVEAITGDLENDETTGTIWTVASTTAVGTFLGSTSGTLTITEVTGTRMTGTFQFNAAGVSGINTGLPVASAGSAQGSFTAELGAFTPPPS